MATGGIEGIGGVLEEVRKVTGKHKKKRRPAAKKQTDKPAKMPVVGLASLKGGY